MMFFGFEFLTGITSYALVGGSGTGKSYQSKFVAAKYKIDFIIDDGLLIKNDRVLAGHSAKEENSIIGAVRVAVFSDKTWRDEVAKRLQSERFRRVLLLGTSEKMVRKIALRLQLPVPEHIIYIEDFAKKEQIETALRTRRVEGKHIIPVPSNEVKKICPEIFLNSLSILKGKVPQRIGFVPQSHEKSLVRPSYSVHKKSKISDFAISLMVENCIFDYNPHIKVKQASISARGLGYRFILTIDVPSGWELEKNVEKLEVYVTENIERLTGLLIEEIYIIIDKKIDIV